MAFFLRCVNRGCFGVARSAVFAPYRCPVAQSDFLADTTCAQCRQLARLLCEITADHDSKGAQLAAKQEQLLRQSQKLSLLEEQMQDFRCGAQGRMGCGGAKLVSSFWIIPD